LAREPIGMNIARQQRRRDRISLWNRSKIAI